MEKSRKLKLSKGQIIDFYRFELFLLLIPLISLYPIIESHFKGEYLRDDYIETTIQTAIVCFLISSLLFLIRRNKLAFKQYNIRISKEEFIEAISRFERKKNISSIKKTDKYYKAYCVQAHWLFSTRIISVIRRENDLLINSISDIESWKTENFGKGNKKLRLEFLKEVANIKKNIPFKAEEEEIIKGEWSLKTILQRLILYPLCLGLLFACLYIAKEIESFTTLIIIIPICVIIFMYLKSDIQLIMKNRKKR